MNIYDKTINDFIDDTIHDSDSDFIDSMLNEMQKLNRCNSEVYLNTSIDLSNIFDLCPKNESTCLTFDDNTIYQNWHDSDNNLVSSQIEYMWS